MVQVNSHILHDFDWKYPVNHLGETVVLAKQLLEEGKEEGGREREGRGEEDTP